MVSGDCQQPPPQQGSHRISDNQKPERGAAPHLTEPEMNSGLGSPSGPGAKLSVARAADMKAYMVAPASATPGQARRPKPNTNAWGSRALWGPKKRSGRNASGSS